MTASPVKPLIVYFGTDWDGANRTSSHHVARWLGQHYPMVFFECPGLRTPSATRGDMGRLRRKLRQAFARPRSPMPGVTVRTLLQLPMHGASWARSLNRLLLRWQVRRALRTAPAGAPVISWFVAPHVGSLIGTLGEARSVYYCVDDFSVFAGVDGGAVSAMDQHLTSRADIVFVSSATLLAEKQRLNPQVHHAPHGVEVVHFRQAVERGPAPPDGFPRTGPVIGYFGLIAEWIDLDLIDRLAVRHPEWQFVMIGRIAVAEESLPVRDNIHFLGPRAYEELPGLGAWFDVAIIPYRLTQQVLRANPIKLREYIAMEKPIVAVDTPDIRTCEALVTIVSSDSEWSDALAAALAAAPDTALAARQREAASGMSWQSRMTAVAARVFDMPAGPAA